MESNKVRINGTKNYIEKIDPELLIKWNKKSKKLVNKQFHKLPSRKNVSDTDVLSKIKEEKNNARIF